jgi:hypothetical protein
VKTDEFQTLISQMKQGPVPRRLVFIWTGPTPSLTGLLQGIELHECDLICAHSNQSDLNAKALLQAFLNTQLKVYGERRNEPSVLLIKEAILLARYGCDLSFLFRYAISPRSAVVLIFPSESDRPLPVRSENWVERNTRTILQRVSRQLGDANCIIKASGG